MMALAAGVVVPNVLRWYWWRINGISYAFGTFAGLVLSLVDLFWPAMPDYVVFPTICTASLVTSIVASVLTKPVAPEVLGRFYESVRPFGFWRPVRAVVNLSMDQQAEKSESLRLTVLNTVLGMVAIAGLYLFPMYLVGHWYAKSILWLTLASVAIVALRFTWYNSLPAPEREEPV